MHSLALWISCLFAFNGFGQHLVQPKEVVVSMGNDAFDEIQKSTFLKFYSAKTQMKHGVVRIKTLSENLPWFTHLMHSKLNRCAGYFLEDSMDEDNPSSTNNNDAFEYSISEQEVVGPLLEQVSNSKLKDTIVYLSSFRNRYCRSPNGVTSQNWIYDTWKKLAEKNSYSIEMIQHTTGNFEQPSVVLTIPGNELKDEIVILGGHGDSIAGWNPSSEVLAPGADDNASGIASLTEVIRILTKENFHPKRTLKFMSYAAEEIGLVGSKEIAKKYSEEKKKVVGVLQLDMTNYKGSAYEIVMMTDYTDPSQNQFIEKLIEHYLPTIHVSSDECGYACSDHASWNRFGFRASIPFESTMDSYNSKIHSANDTLENSSANAEHSVNFAKVSLSFAIEMAKHSSAN